MRKLLCLLILLLPLGVSAKRPRYPAGNVQIAVVKQVLATNPDPGNQLYDFTVKCTNLGDKGVRISNNQFYVVDDLEQSHVVERARYRDQVLLEAGQSVTLERIFIALPRDRKPKVLYLRGLASCPLKK